MRTLAGVLFDLYCKHCQQDSVVEIQDEEGAMTYGMLSCCDRTVEAFTVDVLEMLADCGV